MDTLSLFQRQFILHTLYLPLPETALISIFSPNFGFLLYISIHSFLGDQYTILELYLNSLYNFNVFCLFVFLFIYICTLILFIFSFIFILIDLFLLFNFSFLGLFFLRFPSFFNNFFIFFFFESSFTLIFFNQIFSVFFHSQQFTMYLYFFLHLLFSCHLFSIFSPVFLIFNHLFFLLRTFIYTFLYYFSKTHRVFLFVFFSPISSSLETNFFCSSIHFLDFFLLLNLSIVFSTFYRIIIPFLFP